MSAVWIRPAAGRAGSRQRRARWGRRLAVAVSAVLLAGGLEAPAALAAPAATPKTAGPAAKPAVSEAADVASARVAARLSGRRVEALSERSESATTWVNPDGSLTSELSAGPTRFRRAGQWVNIDETLVRRSDGSVAPQAHPGGLRMGQAGGTRAGSLAAAQNAVSRPLVSVTAGGRSIGLGWHGGLPAPVLDGRRATYPDVVPGSDLVVESRPTGFEQLLVVKQRPAAGADMSFALPLSAPGVRAEQQKDGGILFVDAKSGKQLAVMAAPEMWDAATDPTTGDHLRRAPVRMELAGTDLRVTPDAAFLADPATTYPVTVDPSTTTLGDAFDTWVQSAYTGDLSARTEFRVGPETSAANAPNRGLINWRTAPIAGALVSSATLQLYNFYSGACSRGWQVYSTGLASTATRWSAQPTWFTDPAPVTTTASKGAPCTTAAGWVSADVTAMMTQWASAGAATTGMGFRATTETPDVTYLKRFYSAEQGAAYAPKLTVTYNYRPKDSTNLQAGPPFFNTGGTYYVNTTTPTLRATTGDANNDSVRATFQIFDGATQVASVNSAYVPAGQVASATIPAGALVNGKTYTFKVTCYDGTHWETTSSGPVSFTVDTVHPSAPTALSSTDYPATAWVKGAGQPGNFTVTPPAGGDHQWLEWSLDGTQWTKVATGGAAAAKTFAVTPPRNGTQTLQVRAVDKADNRSDPVSYTFHAGPGGFDSPANGQRTARRISLAAEADAAKYNAVSFSWRRSETDAWTPIPPVNVTSGGTALTSWPVPMTAGKNAPLAWTATDTVNPDGTVQVKADFTGPGGTGATDPVTVVVDRNADGAATDNIGPGSVNLLTGDYALSGTEASMFGMSVTRTASSRSPGAGAAQDGKAAIFGPQWVSGVDAEDTDSDYSHIKQTSTTSLDVVDADDDATHFTAKTGGGWVPEPGAENLTLTGTFAAGFTLSDTDGTVTTFAKVAPAATTWTVTSSLLNGLTNSTTTTVSEAVVVGTKTLARPKRIIAPTSAVTVAACQADPTTKGCRVLEFVYATATTAAGSVLGDYAGQVKAIQVWATTPGAAASTATVVANYNYDATGRLREAWDPRISPALKTSYDYDPAGRVVTLTPPGQLPWTFSYGKAGDPATADDGMLLSVSRPTLTPGSATATNGTATTSLAYGVPLSGGTAPYQLGAADTATWGQTDQPTDATAVFPADAVPASHTGTALTATAYRRAALSYLDVSGRTVNSGDPGGSIVTTEYDKFGNTVRELTAANRNLALGTTPTDTAGLAELGIGGLSSAERAEQLSTRSIYDDTGTRQLEELAPLHELTLEANLMDGTTTVAAAGSQLVARARTLNEYDTGRPTDGTAVVKDQVTKTTVGAQPRVRPDLLADPRATTTGYDWAKGVTTTTVQDPGGLAITKTTQYDADGRVTKTIPPGSTGTDAAATITSYYTATGTAPCGGRPEWADQVCQTLPAWAITGGGTNPTQAVTATTEYGRYGATTKLIETANGVTRTTVTGYDGADRPTTVTATGGVGAAVPTITTAYDPSTGQAATVTSSAGGVVTTGYDALGRARTYTDADGGTTTTTYDALDRPAAVTDTVPSTTTYTYDTTAEPRGLATAMTDSVAGTFRATYNPDGTITTEKLPGGYTVTQTKDPTGSPTTRTYTRDTDGVVITGDAVSESVHGQWQTHTGTPGQESAQTYTYDKTGRLTTVADTTDVTCTRRTYGFNTRSDRTTQTSATSAPGASTCPASGGTSTTHTYDSVDRITDTGYAYDAFGRTSTSPGGVTTAYYANDLVQQQTAGSNRTTWTLDPGLRFRSWTTESDSGGTWTATGSRLNHYDGSGDEPKWTVEDTGTGALTRNVESLTGDLAAITTATGGTVLECTSLHGDVALQLPLDTAVAPTVLAADEYGNPRPGTATARYGWLGGNQRFTDTPTGMTLMGVRLYNPTTGRFLSVDPVPGGSANAYEYCGGDPVNCTDLDGRRGRWLWMGKARLTKRDALRLARALKKGNQYGEVRRLLWFMPWYISALVEGGGYVAKAYAEWIEAVVTSRGILICYGIWQRAWYVWPGARIIIMGGYSRTSC